MKKFKTIISLMTAASLTVAFTVSVSASQTSPEAKIISAEEAVSALMSEGGTAENINFSCANSSQLARFNVPQDMGLPFEDGIMLSTGNATSMFSSKTASQGFGGNGDPDLTDIFQSEGFSNVTNDAVSLSFDLVPTSDYLNFDFFFASTEYDQPKQYNDVFALYVIDSETGEKFNIAKTPFGKPVNVSNTVTLFDNGNYNYTVSSKYFNPVYNNFINGYKFGVLGFSTMFTANAADLVNSNGNKVIKADKPVTLRFAIADASDNILDSAIFIRSNSISYVPVEKKEFTVTFDANGGTSETESAVTGTDGTLETLPTAEFENHVFDGWYTQVTGGEKIEVTTEFEENTTVYAHWLAETYTITFDTDGGNEIADMVYDSNSTDVIPSAEKAGNNFLGWSVVSGDGNWDANEVVAADTSVNGKYGNLNLKAVWEVIPTEETTVEPTTAAPVTAKPTTPPATKDEATSDEVVTENNGVVQTGSVLPTCLTLAVMVSAAGVIFVLRRKNMM